MKNSLGWISFVISFLVWMEPMRADQIDVWIGTSGPHGIHYLVLDTEKGTMTVPVCAAEIAGAGFLVLHEDKNKLYSTGRRQGNEGFVASFSISRANGTASLTPLNTRDIGDSGAAHLNLDHDCRVLLSAQYGGSSIGVFPIQANGEIGERSQLIKHQGGSRVVGNRQNEPHPHWIGPSPGNHFVCVPDLGLDQVVVYKLDSANAALEQTGTANLSPGAGPRHMKFHANGKFAYILNELSMTIAVFHFDEVLGQFALVQEIASLPDELKDKNLNSAAEIRIHANGKFVYTSNRGHDSISVYSIDQESGKLTFVQREAIRGSWPRNFNLDPSGKWLIAAGRYSNTLSLFEVDQATGKLTFTRKVVNVPEPICVLFGSSHE